MPDQEWETQQRILEIQRRNANLTSSVEVSPADQLDRPVVADAAGEKDAKNKGKNK